MLERLDIVRSQRDASPLPWLMASAGFVSALISVGMGYYPTFLHGFRVLVFPGVIFGVVISVSCAFGGYLHGLWKTLPILVLSAAAYYISIITAAGVQIHVLSGDGSMSLLALAV